MSVRQSILYTSFNAGEVTPLLDGAINLDFYRNSARLVRNFITYAQGGVKKRNGFKYIAETKSSGKARLETFSFAVGDSLLLEFGENYIRFYDSDGVIESGGAPLEITTSYSESELFDLAFAQTADLLYIVHRNHHPKILRRLSVTPTFDFADVPFVRGPTLDENETNVTLQASGTTGNVTITASTGIFEPEMVGGIWALTEPSGSLSAYASWQASTSYTTNAFVRNDGIVYRATNSATSGNIAPTHTRGAVSDGGVTWEFINLGTGYISFDNYISATQFSGEVNLTLPNTVTSTATLFWNEGAFSDKNGYPSAISFYQGRLYYAATNLQPQTFWASRTSNRLDDFDVSDGEADASVVFTIDSETVDTIKWLSSQKSLIAGTAGGLFSISGGDINQIITPANIRVSKNTGQNCSNLAPMLINELLVYAPRIKNRLYATRYNWVNDAFVVEDLSVRAEHLMQSGLKEMDYEQSQRNILWIVTESGDLIGCTIEVDQSVVSWHRHETNSFAGENLVKSDFESLTVVPSDMRDDLYVVVKRVIDGETKRYIEKRMTDKSDLYLDSYVFIDSFSAQGLLAGFDHLIGERVVVMLKKAGSVDGLASSEMQVVDGDGQIELPFDCDQVLVGLPYLSELWSSRMISETREGINLFRPQRINNIALNILNTRGISIGTRPGNELLLPQRFTFDLMDNVAPIYGENRPEVIEFVPQGSFSMNNPTIYITSQFGHPCNILNASIQLVSNTK